MADDPEVVREAAVLVPAPQPTIREAFRSGFLAVFNRQHDEETPAHWSFDGPAASDLEPAAWEAYEKAAAVSPLVPAPPELQPDEVVQWAIDRHENTLRLAALKTGDDRDGWLEDAEFWRQIVVRLRAASALSPTPDPCIWDVEEEGSDTLTTSCGHEFRTFDAQGDDIGWIKFCVYCGQPVAASPVSARSPEIP